MFTFVWGGEAFILYCRMVKNERSICLDFNWQEIKTEYISSDISYRQLCAKYGVPMHKLKIIARNEKWVTLRERARHRADTKIVEMAAQQGAKHTLKLYEVADKLLDKIYETLEMTEALDSQSIKHYTSALKDLKDIKGIKSDIDLREQEARIDKLQKEAKTEEAEKTITVTFDKAVDEYGD